MQAAIDLNGIAGVYTLQCEGVIAGLPQNDAWRVQRVSQRYGVIAVIGVDDPAEAPIVPNGQRQLAERANNTAYARGVVVANRQRIDGSVIGSIYCAQIGAGTNPKHPDIARDRNIVSDDDVVTGSGLG